MANDAIPAAGTTSHHEESDVDIRAILIFAAGLVVVTAFIGVMPRRYHAYPPEFQVLNVLSSAGASILGFGYLIPMIYLTWSLRYGRLAGANPWGAVGLEWTTTSPPPTENFEETPVVAWDAYDYASTAEGHVA